IFFYKYSTNFVVVGSLFNANCYEQLTALGANCHFFVIDVGCIRGR
ncbi:hypothetical protein DFO77_10131, partial [Marinilabilia salmonicolor]